MTDEGGQPSSQISLVETSGEKEQTQAAAICGWETALAEMTRWTTVCGRTLAFLVVHSSWKAWLMYISARGLLSILARLWPRSCHTVDTAYETAPLKLQTGLNGPSLSCLCFLTEVNLSAHHKLLPETLADRTAEKLPFVCLCFRLCTKSPIVRGYF